MIVDASDLRWPVDSRGYEWYEPPRDGKFTMHSEGPFLIHKGQGRDPRPITTFLLAPLSVATLFHELATTPPTEQGIVEFAKNCGFLGVGDFVVADWQYDAMPSLPDAEMKTLLAEMGLSAPDRETLDKTVKKMGDFHIPGEPFSAWVEEIKSIGIAIDCWEALRDADQERVDRLQEMLLRPPPQDEPATPEAAARAWAENYNPVAAAWPRNQPPNDPIATALEYLVTEGLRDSVSGVLRRREDGSGWETQFAPLTLIGAIWLQFAAAVSGGIWKNCLYCGAPFKANNRKKIYCSDSHRTLAFQQRKAKGETP